MKVWFLLIFLMMFNASKCQTLFVDFGSGEQDNIYNHNDFPNWSIANSFNCEYSNLGSEGLTTIAENNLDNFILLTGDSVNFQAGDEIIFTWFNSSENMISWWKPLISFEDYDYPENIENAPQWYGMHDYEWFIENDLALGSDINFMYPQETVKSIYIFTADGNTPGETSATEGKHNKINICVNSVNSGLILDRIEIKRALDYKPGSPQNLSVTNNSDKPDTRCDLTWSAPLNGEVLHYRIIRNNIWVDKTKDLFFTDSNLEHNTTYNYQVVPVFNEYTLGDPSEIVTITTQSFQGGEYLIDPLNSIEYLGAFRYPDYSLGTGFTWNRRWGGFAYYPHGDVNNIDGDEDFKGSLYAYGHTYGHRVAEISIPSPVASKNYEDLPRATMLTDSFHYVLPENSPGDYGHPGLVYLPNNDTFYMTIGHYYNQTNGKIPTHGSFKPDFTEINGLWYLGDADSNYPEYYSYNKYMTRVPDDWVNENAPEHFILSGANHTGADPMGPGVVLVRPWNEDGSIPPLGAEISEITLVHYDQRGGEDKLEGWIQKDFWMGSSWISNNNKSALAICGSKAYGEYFYGFKDGSLNTFHIGNIPVTHSNALGGKGSRARSFQAIILFYDPQILANSAKSQLGVYQQGDPNYIEPDKIQPYAYLNIDNILLRENSGDENAEDRVTGMTFDKERSLLYINEHWASEIYDVVHVFRIVSGNSSNIERNDKPYSKFFKLEKNNPNPFNPFTTIQYSLTKTEIVNISVYNIEGQLVSELINGIEEKGVHQVKFDGSDLSSGLYYYKIKVNGNSQTKKMMLLK